MKKAIIKQLILCSLLICFIIESLPVFLSAKAADEIVLEKGQSIENKINVQKEGKYNIY